MKNLTAFLCGLLFGLGLGISGMTKPSKVIGFLNIHHSWDPSLMFVMMGGIAVFASTYPLVRRRSKPIFDNKFQLPTLKTLDKKLIIGAAIFGIGWGLGGYCPGPGLASLASEAPTAMGFVLAMGIGMIAHKIFDQRKKS